MQPVRRSAAIADQVKTEFAIAAFHALVHFACGYFCFTHNDLKMPDQRFHFRIYIFLFAAGNIPVHRHGILLLLRR